MVAGLLRAVLGFGIHTPLPTHARPVPAPKPPAHSSSDHCVFDPSGSHLRTLISGHTPSRVSGSGGGVRPSLRVLGLAASRGDRHRREPQLSVEANIVPGPALRPAGGCQGLAPLSRSRQPGFDGPGRGGQTGGGPAVQRGTDRWCAECSAEHGGWWGRGKTAGGCRAQISPWMYPKSCSRAVEICSPSPPRSRQTRARVTWGLWQLD